MLLGRGRRCGLAIITRRLVAGTVLCAVLVNACSGTPPAATPVAQWQLVIRDGQGVLLRVALPNGAFTLRYRNSVYRSLAEERFRVGDDGALQLVELASDEAAVLDEYYVTGRRPRPTEAGDLRRWRAPPATPLMVRELRLLASAHGERTLVVGDTTVPLWQLDAHLSALVLAAERSG